ncbi:pyruvate/2-oxoglutarate/acetoin dehydrogenase E1 component [Streptomyces turgidiscabies]|uniref:Pyruvate/2-oxoglutarate/acetoin dehydrogenase E1 component n=1 Tax=Streptomyces turgidiscabies TaxID=85558 RepID=A0ABU0RXM5_9ACTN|nr:pyruvate/2-oxoglutarate/acetoin dehydrogenase E1 component [Streptomyces turgidiscabies]
MADLTGAQEVAAPRQITYREAVAEGIAREMRRDPAVVCLGEDIGEAGGVFKTTAGLFKEFGSGRVWDTPISEQAIVGAAMGAAMTGMRPVAEIMFSDFLACCWDYLANEMPKVRYMTGGQVTVPLVVRTANGGGLGFGAQHSQATENWAFTVPGLKIAAPSTPADVIGMMASAIRSDDPVVFFEHKGLFATKGAPAPPDHVVELGKAAVVREGADITLVALASMVPLALTAAERLAGEGIDAEVVDLRCLVPLDVGTVLASLGKTSRLTIVEENPYQGGWGATLASVVADEGFGLLDAPVRRVWRGSACRCRSPTRWRSGSSPPWTRSWRPYANSRPTDMRTDAPYRLSLGGRAMTDRLLLRSGHVISMDPDIGELPQGDVLIEDGRIVAVEREIGADAEVLDMTGRIVIPGFVDTHRRTWEAPIRGCAPNATLDDYFVDVLDTFAPVYTPEDVYAGNLAGALRQHLPFRLLVREQDRYRATTYAASVPSTSPRTAAC